MGSAWGEEHGWRCRDVTAPTSVSQKLKTISKCQGQKIYVRNTSKTHKWKSSQQSLEPAFLHSYRQRQDCPWLLLVSPFMLWISASQSVVPGACHKCRSWAPLQAPWIRDSGPPRACRDSGPPSACSSRLPSGEAACGVLTALRPVVPQGHPARVLPSYLLNTVAEQLWSC